MWVKRPNGAEIRCQLVCKGCYQETTDKDDTYSSTPLLISLKLLLRIGPTKKYKFNFYGVSAAFLHAELKENVYERPLVELYPGSGVVWKLCKALARRWPQRKVKCTSRRLWPSCIETTRDCAELHFSGEYLHVMSYVDDILAVGLQDSLHWFYTELPEPLMVKHLGKLHVSGKDITFLGLAQEMVELLGLGNGKMAGVAALGCGEPSGLPKSGWTPTPGSCPYDQM